MQGLVAGLVIVGVILFVAGYVLVYIAQLANEALKALGEAASASKAELGSAFFFMKSWTARRIGRADQQGGEVESFEPSVTVVFPTSMYAAEEQSYKESLVTKTVIPPSPRIAVPTFPAIPDVLVIPEIQFNLGSTASLSSDHIPTLLNSRSHGCCVPTSLEKVVMPTKLHITPWAPPDTFPPAPIAPKISPAIKQRLVLNLPLYTVKQDASAFRVWLVRKLNDIVRGVHHKRIADYEKQKERIQVEYDEKALANAVSALRFETELALWETIRVERAAGRAEALARYEYRAAEAQATYKSRLQQYETDFETASRRLADFWQRVENREPEAVCGLFNIALARVITPLAFPREWVLEYDADQGILVLDLRLPDFERIQITKKLALKREVKTKPVGVKEQKQLAETASCLYLLRAIHEVVQHDLTNAIQALTVNGWVEYVDATTGRDRSVVIVSIFAEKDQLREIDIGRVDPVKCIASLGGRFAGIQHGYVAIAPIVRLNRHDDRVIEGSDVLSDLATGTNLAAMPWDKFEHLIRQLFEKVFAGPGIEVKVTRASRDRGVDAIIFDPDPIRGGKTVIQAKRYVNTVDLSAVRDLYGTVVNEGANKGILVTTSSFGPDAYEFSKDKNLTLLTGRELLGLLEKHGYQYRIDLDEARKLYAASAGSSHKTASTVDDQ